MPIDRAPWNALVDDDGSNLTGSIWNKAAIKDVILDPTDAALAAAGGLPTGGVNDDVLTRDLAVATFGSKWAGPGASFVWKNEPFVAANFTAAAPMIWTVGAPAVLSNRYAVVGKIMFWALYMSWFSGSNVLSGAPGPELRIKAPGGFSTSAGLGFNVIAYTAGVAGVPVLSGLSAADTGAGIAIKRGDGGNFALSDVPGFITTMVLEIL